MATAGFVAALLVGGSLLLSSPVARATTAYAKDTGKPCGFCHGALPKLNETGEKFRANGHKL